MSACIILSFHREAAPKAFSFFDIGKKHEYFQPAGGTQASGLSHLKAYPQSKANAYLSGTFLQSLTPKSKQVKLIKSLIDNGQLELLGGTYYHSLSCLFSIDLFMEEVTRHQQLIHDLFGVTVKGFVNTYGIFANDLIGPLIKSGFDYAIAPKIDWFLGGHTQKRAFHSRDKTFKLILAGDHREDTNDEPKVIFQDGTKEVSWAPDFKTWLCGEFLQEQDLSATYSLPTPSILAEDGSDIAQLLGNALQKQLIEKLREIAPKMLKSGSTSWKESLLQLSAAEQFQRISQKNPHDIRYHHYTWMINTLTDLELQLQKRK